MLTLSDGELKSWDNEERENILFGDPGDGTKWYKADLSEVPQSP
jgi:hypothetical protein